MKNALLPVFMNLKREPSIVIGGGVVAFQKIKQLVESKSIITVISPSCIKEIQNLHSIGAINWIQKKYNRSLIGNPKIIIGATSNKKVNKSIYHDAESLGIPVNIVDQPELCSFYFGAVHTDGNIKIAVSTNGKSPSIGKKIRDFIASNLPDSIDNIASKFYDLREKLKSNMNHIERKYFLNSLSENQFSFKNGKVFLVGVGPGSPEHLTLKAVDLISKAEIIFYDALIHPSILSLSSNKTSKVYVGKRSDQKNIHQNTINNLMVEHAKLGKVVVRLKGGDPFIFGRGGEEAMFLKKNEIPFEIIPGISSGVGVASQLGLPLTYRNYSKGVIFLTGHEIKKSINWQNISQLNLTLVIFMGLGNSPEIISNLLKHGKSKNTPIALIQKGTTPQEKIVVGDIGSIINKLKSIKLEKPVIIIIGDVVHIYNYLKANNSTNLNSIHDEFMFAEHNMNKSNFSNEY